MNENNPPLEKGKGGIHGDDYPRFLQQLIKDRPRAGAGLHPWIFSAARILHAFHEPEKICEILTELTKDCGRTLEPHEIPDAVKNSAPYKWVPSDKSIAERRTEWAKNPITKVIFDPEAARLEAARVSFEITPKWLALRSKLPVTEISTDQYLRIVFRKGECAIIFTEFKSQGGIWRYGQSMKDFCQTHYPDGVWFLCNPVNGKKVFNPRTRRQSQRSEEEVTSWRYAVLECDHEPKEVWWPIWLKILVQLELRIISLVTSGGKSIHALVRVNAGSKAEWDAFKRRYLKPLIKYGACDGSLSAVRLTRLPGCYRGGYLQELLYLNPDADGQPILQQPTI